MNIAIVVIMFLVIWGWLIYEIYYAPEYEENEMPVKKNNIHIDITEEDIIEDLNSVNGQEEE